MRPLRKGAVLFFVTALFSVFACMGASAASPDGYFSYSAVSGGVQVTSYTGAENVMDIPEKLGGKYVVSVGANVIVNKADVSGVVIPSHVKTIEANAFNGCTNLVSASIGPQVTSIGENAFNGCIRLTNVNIPSSVRTIGSYAFYNTGLYGITIPGTVETVGDGAFAACNYLQSVAIQNGTRSLGGSVFLNCLRLYSLELPVSVTSIGADLMSTTAAYNPYIYVYAGSYAASYAQDYNKANPGTPYNIIYMNTNNAYSVAFQSARINMYVGQNLGLGSLLSIEPADYTDSIDWKSFDTSIVTVDNYGNATAQKTGTVTVRATATKGLGTVNNIYGNITITVKKAPTSITVTQKVASGQKATHTLAYGSTMTFKTTIKPKAAALAPLTVTSSNTKAVRVINQSTLTVQGVGEGSATLTFKTYNGKKATYKVNVVVQRGALPGWTQTKKTLTAGKSFTLSDVSGMTFRSSDTSVAKVDSKGKVTGISAGTATIYAIKGDLAGQCVVTVKAPAIKTTRIIDTAVDGKKVSIKYKKVSGVDGYEIQWRLKSQKTYTESRGVKRNKNRSNWVSFTCKSNSVYYYKIRTFKWVAGNRVYSKWSSAKKVKTGKAKK